MFSGWRSLVLSWMQAASNHSYNKAGISCSTSIQSGAMGRNDNRVKERLGKEAWNVVIERTKDGTITFQHMKDISQVLDSTVGGNHSRRVKNIFWAYNDFEMREILSGTRNYTNLTRVMRWRISVTSWKVQRWICLRLPRSYHQALPWTLWKSHWRP